MLKLQKGDRIEVDRFQNGIIYTYTVQRICRRHINVKNKETGSGWCMPYNRVKDCKVINVESGVCRVCGCTDTNCTDCIEKTGGPCHWVDEEHTLCSACEITRKEAPNV